MKFVALFLLFAPLLVVSQYCFSNCTNPTHYRPLQVEIGVYVKAIQSIDTVFSTAQLDFFVWLKWPECALAPNSTEFIRPDLSFSIENVFDRSEFVFTPLYTVDGITPEPDCTNFPGMVYSIWRASGPFTQNFDFRRFPLDYHTIHVDMEDHDYPKSDLVYVFDNSTASGTNATGYADELRAPGWSISDFNQSITLSYYDTNWGAFGGFASQNVYSKYSWQISINRGPSILFLKALPPVFFTVFSCTLVWLLDPEVIEVRMGTSVSSLLTLIFLQTLLTESVPEVDYLTIIDYIFLSCYIQIFLVMVEVMIMNKLYGTWTESAKTYQEMQAKQRRLRKLMDSRAKEYNNSQVMSPLPPAENEPAPMLRSISKNDVKITFITPDEQDEYELEEKDLDYIGHFERREKEKEIRKQQRGLCGCLKTKRFTFKSAYEEKMTKAWVNKIENRCMVAHVLITLISTALIIGIVYYAPDQYSVTHEH